MDNTNTHTSKFVLNKENAFCISLLSKNDRWIKMVERFKYFGMEDKVTRWIASTEPKENFVYYLNNGQRCCAQSHINVWRHIVENNLEYALILEDDACFDKKWLEKLDVFFTQNQDTEWDALFLNASEPCFPLNEWTNANEQYLCGGYILSNKGAKTILDMFAHCYFSSDWMTRCLETHGHSYTYYPWLIIQEGNETTIGSGFELDHLKVVRCLEEIKYDIENYV